jgi:hypoxanthine phosphoribosyltransferase
MSEALDIAPLISAQTIEARVNALADKLSPIMSDDWIVIALMDGAMVFASDLLRALQLRGINPVFENLMLSSYGDNLRSAGEVKVIKDFSRDLSGRSVLILDDVFETGLTLATAANMAKAAGAMHVKSCVFAYKSGYSEGMTQPDFKGWDAPDGFLVGYGMDFQGRFRGLPYIADLRP